MRADNSRHLAKAAHSRAMLDSALRATATTSSRNSFGNALGMVDILPVGTDSPHKLAVNQTLGSPPRRTTAPAVPARQAATDASLRQRLQLAHQRIRELEVDNHQLRHALAQALGDRRARHARDPLEYRP